MGTGFKDRSDSYDDSRRLMFKTKVLGRGRLENWGDTGRTRSLCRRSALRGPRDRARVLHLVVSSLTSGCLASAAILSPARAARDSAGRTQTGRDLGLSPYEDGILVIDCNLKSDPKMQRLKWQTFLISQFWWVRSSSTALRTGPGGCSQGVTV